MSSSHALAEKRSRRISRHPPARAGNSVAFNAFPWASVSGQYSTAFGPKPIPAATRASRPLAAFHGLGRRGRPGGEKQEQQRGWRRIGVRWRGTLEFGPRGVLDADGTIHQPAVGVIGDHELARRVFDVASQLRAPARCVHPDDAGAGQCGTENLEHVLRHCRQQQPTCGGRSGREWRAAMRPVSRPPRPPHARSMTAARRPGRRCRRRHVRAPVRTPSTHAESAVSSCDPAS